MAELKCAVDSCTYNSDRLCCKGDILVGGKNARKEQDTCCESFQERTGDSMMNSMASGCGCTNISIDCAAQNCQFNEACKCTAGGIQISGSQACCSDDTRCSSFKCG